MPVNFLFWQIVPGVESQRLKQELHKYHHHHSTHIFNAHHHTSKMRNMGSKRYYDMQHVYRDMLPIWIWSLASHMNKQTPPEFSRNKSWVLLGILLENNILQAESKDIIQLVGCLFALHTDYPVNKQYNQVYSYLNHPLAFFNHCKNITVFFVFFIILYLLLFY